MKRTRRQFLAVATALSATVAGCSSPDSELDVGGDDPSGTSSDDSGANGEANSDAGGTGENGSNGGDRDGQEPDGQGEDDQDADGNEDETSNEIRGYDVFQDAPVGGGILAEGEDEGVLAETAVFETREELVEFASLDGVVQQSALNAWLDDIWFEHANVYYVSVYVPDPAYEEISIDHIAIEDGELTLDVDVDTTGETGRPGTAPPPDPSIEQTAAFVRVTADQPPEALSVSVLSDWERYEWFATADALLDPSVVPGGVSPDSGPVALPTGDECESLSTEPQTAVSDIAWGSVRNSEGNQPWVFRIESESDDLTFEYGDTFSAHLTNVSYSSRTTGSSGQAELQLLTERGWLPVVSSPAVFALAFVHSPGSGHEWEFELTPEGIAEAFGVDIELYDDEREELEDEEGGEDGTDEQGEDEEGGEDGTDEQGEDEEDDGRGIDVSFDEEVCAELPVGRYRLTYPVAEQQIAVGFDYLGKN